MSDATAEPEEAPEKASKLPMILGLVAMIAGAGGGFFATFSGMILAEEQPEQVVEEKFEPAPLPEVSYVEIEPMIISIGPLTNGKHLRFRAQLEIADDYVADVESVLPRILDVINSYLRALRIEDLEKPLALTRVRSHLLRRIDLVTGTGRVNDLLVTEFVLN